MDKKHRIQSALFAVVTSVDGLVNPLEKRREVDERWSPAPAHKGDGAGQDG
jgi:hypothetical protein